MFDNNDHTTRPKCYLYSSSPSNLLDWNNIYSDDSDTKVIITTLLGYKPDDTPKKVIESVHMVYMQHLKNGHIVITCKKIMLYKPVNVATKCTGLIITPKFPHRKLFDNFHSGPSEGYLSTYKILFSLQMWFFWQYMREDTKQ